MLEAIRKRTGGIVVKIFLGILILSFAVWGIGDTIRSLSTVTEVAAVGNVSISPEQLSNDMQREMNRLRASFKDQQFDMEQARALGIPKAVLDNIIINTLFSLGAKDIGVRASDKIVTDEIRKNPAFNDALGKFDRFTFQQTIRNYGFTEASFIKRVRDNIERAQYLESLATGGMAPDILAEAIYRHRQEKRIAETMIIADDAMTNIAEPGKVELSKFHQDNARLFTSPEYLSLSFITIKIDDLAKEISVSDADLQKAYDNRKNEFNIKERRHLQQIIVANEDDAIRAHKMLTNGRDFVDVAREVAHMDAKSLDIGTVSREEILQELANVSFELPNNGFSNPVQSPLGWHLLRVVKIYSGRQKTMNEVREKLSRAIAKEKATDNIFAMSNQLEDELGGGATLEEAASHMNLELAKIAAIDNFGNDTKGNVVSELPAGNFLKVAFSTPENTESPLTEAGTEGYFVLRVDKVIPPALRPLATIGDKVSDAWKAERRKEAAKKAATAAFQRLNGGDDMASLASEMKVEIKTSKAFTRSPKTAVNNMPATLIGDLFKIKPGKFAMARGPKGNYIARLKEIQTADPAKDKNGLQQTKQELTSNIRDDLVKQLANALRQRYPVSVDKRAVDQLF